MRSIKAELPSWALLSSRPTKSQAKLNDYFKPLNLGVICDTAIVKGTVCEWKPEINKISDTFLPLHNYFSFIISHSLYMWITAMMGHPSKGWKGNVGLWLLLLPKAGMIQSPNFREWTFQVGRKKEIAMSYGLKTSKVAFLLINSLFCKSLCNSTTRNDELFGIICLFSLPRKWQQKENQES